MTQICEEPSRFERNASLRPSGEYFGSESRFSPEVIRCASPPAAGATQMAEREVLASTSGVDTA